MVTKISGFVMFCVLSANPDGIDIKTHQTYEWISKCHLALTEHNFSNTEECFCTKVTGEIERE